MCVCVCVHSQVQLAPPFLLNIPWSQSLFERFERSKCWCVYLVCLLFFIVFSCLLFIVSYVVLCFYWFYVYVVLLCLYAFVFTCVCFMCVYIYINIYICVFLWLIMFFMCVFVYWCFYFLFFLLFFILVAPGANPQVQLTKSWWKPRQISIEALGGCRTLNKKRWEYEKRSHPTLLHCSCEQLKESGNLKGKRISPYVFHMDNHQIQSLSPLERMVVSSNQHSLGIQAKTNQVPKYSYVSYISDNAPHQQQKRKCGKLLEGLGVVSWICFGHVWEVFGGC